MKIKARLHLAYDLVYEILVNLYPRYGLEGGVGLNCYTCCHLVLVASAPSVVEKLC